MPIGPPRRDPPTKVVDLELKRIEKFGLVDDTAPYLVTPFPKDSSNIITFPCSGKPSIPPKT